jgi:hypothetical protein
MSAVTKRVDVSHLLQVCDGLFARALNRRCVCFGQRFVQSSNVGCCLRPLQLCLLQRTLERCIATTLKA